MAAAKPKSVPDAVGEEGKLGQKYGGAGMNKQAGGMNNILQKRLNKGGQKFFDSGDYNMAKANKVPAPKGTIGDSQSNATGEQRQEELAEATIEENPGNVCAEDKDTANTKQTSEPAGAKLSNDEPQRGYPRKVVPIASPLAKQNPVATVTSSVIAGGPIPQPRSLAAHLTHATHSGPFVTHPARVSPSSELPPTAFPNAEQPDVTQ